MQCIFRGPWTKQYEPICLCVKIQVEKTICQMVCDLVEGVNPQANQPKCFLCMYTFVVAPILFECFVFCLICKWIWIKSNKTIHQQHAQIQFDYITALNPKGVFMNHHWKDKTQKHRNIESFKYIYYFIYVFQINNTMMNQMKIIGRLLTYLVCYPLLILKVE